MKILVITSSYPRNEKDFSGLFVQDWVESLACRGIQSRVLAWRGEGASSTQRVRFVPYGPKEWETLFFGNGGPENLRENPLRVLLALPAMAQMWRAAEEELRKGEYDALVAHWLVPAGLLVRGLGARYGLPSFVVGHSGGVHLLGKLGPLGSALAGPLGRGALTLPSEGLKEKWKALSPFQSDPLVAPMGYSPFDTKKHGRRRGYQQKDEVRFGFLGRLVAIKGLEVVLKAFRQWWPDSGRRPLLEILGSGAMEHEWRAMAGDESANVRFLGPLFGDEKARRVASWDFLVLPSKRSASGRHEGLPVSLLEASSLGVIPLVGHIPGVERWLAEPNRQIIDSAAAEVWQNELHKCATLEEQELTNWQEATKEIVAPLAWESYSAWWAAWLQGPRSSSAPTSGIASGTTRLGGRH